MFSEVLTAQFGKLAAVEVPVGDVMDTASVAGAYADLFWLMCWIGLGCAAVAFIAVPVLKRMMHGVR